jgi:DNA-binding MarR family transcriptional regulator
MDGTEEADGLIEDWRSELPSLDFASVRVFLPLRRALQAAEARRAPVLARHGITPAMLDMLVAVRRVGPPYVSTPSDLARQLVLSAGGVSQRLERLEQAAFVERTTNTEDRRSVAVRLTDTGRRALDELIHEYMAHEDQLLGALSADERTQLAVLLGRLHTSITAVDDD